MSKTLEDRRGCSLQLKFSNVITIILLCMELVPASRLTGGKVHDLHSGVILRVRTRSKCFHPSSDARKHLKTTKKKTSKKESATDLPIKCTEYLPRDYPRKRLKDRLCLKRVMQLMLTIAITHQDD